MSKIPRKSTADNVCRAPAKTCPNTIFLYKFVLNFRALALFFRAL